jgi:HYR domain/FIMAH domain
MNQVHTTRFSFRLRLVCGLALFLGLCIMLGGLARPAHAQSNLSVSDCSADTQLQAAVSQANSDNAGDVITFACSGDIKLSSTLTISGSMTLDGSGQNVTLDGGDSVRVLSVNSGVSLALKALTIAHGSGGLNGGGGLFNVGTVSISNSTFAYNSGVGGGGLWNGNGSTMSISNSTFANNSTTSGRSGGGLFSDVSSTVTISNSTFAYNSAYNGNGGGLSNAGTMSISNSTFADNSATDGGGLFNFGTESISGSVVAANTGGNCDNFGFGSITDQGYNLSSDSSCGFTGTGSLQNTDPKLGPLASNGGPTQTLALQQGSPAIDQIPAAQCPTTDQRGAPRLDDSETTCDMGAYESGAQPPNHALALTNMPANITVNASSPNGAVVTYTSPTAADESGDSPGSSVSCTPASGSTFPIGSTTVHCTATDPSGNSSSGSFQVVVKGAAAQVNDLITMVNGDHLSSSLQNALDAKLNPALKAINAGQTATACSDLTDFIGLVQSQTGKRITTSQATQLVAAAKQVQAVLGC